MKKIFIRVSKIMMKVATTRFGFANHLVLIEVGAKRKVSVLNPLTLTNLIFQHFNNPNTKRDCGVRDMWLILVVYPHDIFAGLGDSNRSQCGGTCKCFHPWKVFIEWSVFERCLVWRLQTQNGSAWARWAVPSKGKYPTWVVRREKRDDCHVATGVNHGVRFMFKLV